MNTKKRKTDLHSNIVRVNRGRNVSKEEKSPAISP